MPDYNAVRRAPAATVPMSLLAPASTAVCTRSNTAAARTIARTAVRSLHVELALYPKPGLVSLVDNGSHRDMDASTFVRSLFALRHYFFQIAVAGAEDAPFPVLRQLGIVAERRMLGATGGINTHRGAIFSLGLLCAAAGRCARSQRPNSPAAIRMALVGSWGAALRMHQGPATSHGSTVAAHYAASGAREEAALGFPSVFEVALPRLLQTLQEGRSMRCARIDALFALMARMSDTNVYHRGGPEGAQVVRRSAQAFLAAGGTAADDWLQRATVCHHVFVAQNLSPGGAADLLAATEFIHAMTVHRPLPGPRGG